MKIPNSKFQIPNKFQISNFKLKILFVVLVLAFSFQILAYFSPVMAVQTATESGTSLGTIGTGKGFGQWAWDKIFESGEDVSGATGLLNKIISTIIGVITICAGIYFIFQFIIGAFTWMTAGSNQESIKKAQQVITNAVMGLVIVVAAYAIIGLVSGILGFDLLHPERLIPLLGPTR